MLTRNNKKSQRTGSNEEIISRYTDQPATMPAQLKRRIEEVWHGDPVQLYALADLDGSMNLLHHWIALGPKNLAIVRDSGDNAQSPVEIVDRSKIRAVRESPGLSCNVLTLLGEPGEPALAVFRYTHRQRRAIDNIKFVLEQQIEGHDVDSSDPDDVYSDSMALAVKDAQASFTVNRMAVAWRLLGYLAPYKWQVAFGMTAAVSITLLTLVPPYLTRYLIDDIIRPSRSNELSAEIASRWAWILIAALAGVIVLREICAYIRLRTMAVLGEYVARDLRTDLYDHLQKLSLNYFSKKQTGTIISRVSSDTDRLWDFIAFGVVEVSLAVIMLFGLGTVLLCLDLQLGLVMTVPVPIVLWAIFCHGRKMKRIFLRCWRKWSNLTAVLANTIPGMRVVKAFNQEEQEKIRFGRRNTDCTNEFNNIHRSWTRFWPLLMLGVNSMMLLVWMAGLPRMVGLSEEAVGGLSMGTFVSFLLYMGMFFYPIEIIGQMSRMLNRAVSSAHRIFEVLDTEPQITQIEKPVCLSPVNGSVEFQNVTFAYDGVRQVIRGISFAVRPGEMIGLVGPSGSGKTTVTNLIVRFHDVSSGRILVDGVDLREVDLGHYRRQVGMVLQDPYLFHGPILDNIRYGRPDADLEEVVEAARVANAHDFVCKLPHGYDTIVGERGQTLSGGERQRISIARAILSDPRILILDEATSSVDTETERKIQEALERLIAGRTVFAIAHRLSTLRRATRLFVIEDGCIAEEGTHAELLRKEDGIYKKLHTMQQELHEMYAV